MLVYPAVIYAFLGYSISLVITVAVNILNPFVLQAPPYNWSPQINGLINIPGILGNLFGAWAGGKTAMTVKCYEFTDRNQATLWIFGANCEPRRTAAYTSPKADCTC
jgi:hypothetical protein